jgi:hypothetical protein
MTSGKDITFLYKNFPTLGDSLKPVAEFFLSYDGGEKNVPVVGLIDTGADCSLLPYGLAFTLRIPQEKLTQNAKRVKCGCGKEIGHYHTQVKMRIGEHEFVTPIIFVTPRKVKDNHGKVMQEDINAILGRDAAFTKFDVLFKEREKKIIFTPV